MLPKEYGGDAGNVADLNSKHKHFIKQIQIDNMFFLEQWCTKLAEYTTWFKEQEKSKANEALRPGSPKTADDLFGMDGTFRKLSID